MEVARPSLLMPYTPSPKALQNCFDYRLRLFEKLNVENNTELVAFTTRAGLI